MHKTLQSIGMPAVGSCRGWAKASFRACAGFPKAKDARETDGIPLLLRPKARGLTAGCYGLGGETGFTPAQNTLTRNFSPRRASNKELYSTVAAGEMR